MKCYQSSYLAWELSVSQLAELKVLMDSVYIQDSCTDKCFTYLSLSPNARNNCYYSNEFYMIYSFFFPNHHLGRIL